MDMVASRAPNKTTPRIVGPTGWFTVTFLKERVYCYTPATTLFA